MHYTKFDKYKTEKVYVVAIASFKMNNNSTSDCNDAIIYEPIYPNKNWLRTELNGDLMCLSSKFRFDNEEFFNFSLILIGSTVLTAFLFIIIKHNWKFEEQKDDRPMTTTDQTKSNLIGNLFRRLRGGEPNDGKGTFISANRIESIFSRPKNVNKNLEPSLDEATEPKLMKAIANLEKKSSESMD